MAVGSGIGPATRAPVRIAVSTISPTLWSRSLKSYAFIRMRIFWEDNSAMCGPRAPFAPLLDDLGHDARADGAAALADREAQLLVHRDRRDQLHHHLDVVPGHHHLRALGQVRNTRHVRRPEVELRP